MLLWLRKILKIEDLGKLASVVGIKTGSTREPFCG